MEYELGENGSYVFLCAAGGDCAYNCCSNTISNCKNCEHFVIKCKRCGAQLNIITVKRHKQFCTGG